MGDKIKKTNEFKTHMMQQISHELQTPLQAMLFAHDIIKEHHAESLNDEQRQLLGTIRNGIRKIAEFRKQYLDLAKVESGVMEYNMTPLELVHVVEPLVDEAKLIAAQKKYHCRTNGHRGSHNHGRCREDIRHRQQSYRKCH